MVIGSLATLDLPMVVDLIGIFVLKGSYCTLTMIDWFLPALSVIPRGTWGDVARCFTMIRWVSPKMWFRSRKCCEPMASCIPEPLRVTQVLVSQFPHGNQAQCVEYRRRKDGSLGKTPGRDAATGSPPDRHIDVPHRRPPPHCRRATTHAACRPKSHAQRVQHACMAIPTGTRQRGRLGSVRARRAQVGSRTYAMPTSGGGERHAGRAHDIATIYTPSCVQQVHDDRGVLHDGRVACAWLLRDGHANPTRRLHDGPVMSWNRNFYFIFRGFDAISNMYDRSEPEALIPLLVHGGSG
ncbi:hypothetical protein F511_40680 [Dorcoceras hygrometricum]|uniref:Uncharacterized protein n=1 Tax=Dorcoceras hygrometricum TaxID=472368 RepID=A0A2Z7AQS4_9LAMI|nr:hypothetical protein F511_40680 [Dorcoceras hygrometricum]